jgi:hypothetical protein
MSAPVPAVPDGTVLVHAGFHKTGTTALQSALEAARLDLAGAGVCYPGELRSHHRAAMGLTGRTWGWRDQGGRPPREVHWRRLRAESAAHEGRVIISTESLALADDAAVDRLIAELGADRVQAVFTLRPFAKLLASSYQQYLKYGLDWTYADWLEAVFRAPPKCKPSPNFWRRNDHAGVMGRWADRLGPERVTLVVLDDRDRGALFRTFEALLGLPSGMLVPDAGLAGSNRSMTAAEAEMLRLVNARGARQWRWAEYQDGVRRGAVLRMVDSRRPAPDEPMLATPAWAVERAQAFGRETAGRVRGLGIRVLGDVDRLADPIPAGEPAREGLLLPVEAAAEAVLGGILGALEDRPPRDELDEVIARARVEGVEQASGRVLAGALAQRVRTAPARRRAGRGHRVG